MGPQTKNYNYELNEELLATRNDSGFSFTLMGENIAFTMIFDF